MLSLWVDYILLHKYRNNKTVSSCSVIMLWKIVPYAQKYKNTYAALRVFRDGIMHIQILIAFQVQIQPTTYVLCVFVYIIMKESRKLLSWDLCSSTSMCICINVFDAQRNFFGTAGKQNIYLAIYLLLNFSTQIQRAPIGSKYLQCRIWGFNVRNFRSFKPTCTYYAKT